MIIPNHAPSDYICPFCLVVNGIENEHVITRQDDVVYRTDRVVGFVASHRFTHRSPNFLVVPTAHFENIYELPASYGTDILEAKKVMAMALKQVYQCAGISTRQHNEPCGSQDVWHYHEHITPRFRHDFLYGRIGFRGRALMTADIRTSHAANVRSEINRLLDNKN